MMGPKSIMYTIKERLIHQKTSQTKPNNAFGAEIRKENKRLT